MVLGKLPLPGRPTNLDYSRTRARAYCGWAIFFLSSIISCFFLPLSGRRPDIDCNTVSKGPLNRKQPTNQHPLYRVKHEKTVGEDKHYYIVLDFLYLSY